MATTFLEYLQYDLIWGETLSIQVLSNLEKKVFKKINYFFKCVLVFRLYGHLCDGVGPPELELQSCELPCGYWELNLGPLE